MDRTLSRREKKLVRLGSCVACIRMAAVLHLNTTYVLQSKRRVAWWFNGQLEDNRRFTGCDADFATHVGLLSATAILRRGRHSWGFRLLGWRTTLDVRYFSHPSWHRFFPSVPGHALSGASK